MAPEVAVAKRLQKDLTRLSTKIEKLESKMSKLEEKRDSGKLKPERFHAKKATIKQQIKGYDKTARTIRGKLGKAQAAGVV